MKYISLLALVLGFCANLQAQTSILQETFNSGIPANWTVVIEDTSMVHPNVSSFSPGWIALVDPDNNTDTIVGSTSYFTSPAQASRWLITPPLALGAYGNILRWEGKVHDPSFADGYLVLVSTTDTQLTSFTDTLRVVGEESENWLQREINLSDSGYVSQTIYLAFINKSFDKFKLYLDDFSVTINDPVGIQEAVLVDINLFPNPAQHSIAIQTNKVVSHMQVISVNGQSMHSGSFQNELMIESWQNGVYLIILETNEGRVVQRFIKN
jgi:hypothetical protein